QIQTTVKAYGAAISAGDKDAFLSCFADDAVQIDPYPNPANKGKDAIGGWWDAQMQMADSAAFEVKDVIVCGDRASVPWRIVLTMGGGKMQIEGVDIFVIDDNGQIGELTAYWDPARITPA